MRIQDSQLRALVQQMQSQADHSIDDTKVLEFLAGIGDRAGADARGVLQRLTRPNISREDQLAIAQAGLDTKEREDLTTLLDDTSLQWSPGARNFLEALAGRAELGTNHGPLVLSDNLADGIKGTAKEGDVIEAINLSTAPEARLHLDNTTAIAEADRWGNFSGNLPDVQAGDIVRMRTRSRDGSVSDWITVQAQGLGDDTRNAQLNLERLDLDVQSNGQIKVIHNTARPFTEPGAQLRLTNLRTGETFDTTATDKGSLPDGFMVEGQAGDHFSIAVSDGTNNADFAQTAGVLKTVASNTNANGQVDLPDPEVRKKDKKADGSSRYKTERFTGPLFIDGPSHEDVKQGAIGNCYLASAMGSLAKTDPDALRDMITDNGDGTFTVKFYENTYYGNPRTKEVTVDTDFYVRSYGGPVYGASLGGSTSADKMELWFPLVEKAYAKLKGSYETIGNGGSAGDVMSAVLGKSSRYMNVSSSNAQQAFDRIKEAEENGWPMAAGTYGKDRADLYTNSGVYAWHSYSVLGVEEENGTKYVKLRNPWGQSEAGHDGKNDGIFRLELDKFTELYRSISYVEG